MAASVFQSIPDAAFSRLHGCTPPDDTDSFINKPNVPRKSHEQKVKSEKAAQSSEPTILRRFSQKRNLAVEKVRLETFHDWPSNIVDKYALAKAGMFYLHHRDLVQCYFCTVIIGYWRQGDVPAIEHEEHQPSCPLVRGVAYGNVPLDDLHQPITDLVFDSLAKPLHTHAIPEDSQQLPKHPPMTSSWRRMTTFRDTDVRFPDAQQMADSGFFLIGVGDITLCYQCNGGIMNWSCEDNPEEIHRHFYPQCPLSKVENEPKIPSIIEDKPSIDLKLIRNLLISKKLLGMDWSEEIVSGAIKKYIEDHLSLPSTIGEGLETVLDYEYSMKS